MIEGDDRNNFNNYNLSPLPGLRMFLPTTHGWRHWYLHKSVWVCMVVWGENVLGHALKFWRRVMFQHIQHGE